MLAPKFSLRQLLVLMFAAGIICSILGFAARGSVVAYGMGIAIIGVVFPFLLFACVYWSVLFLSKLLLGKHATSLAEQKEKEARRLATAGSPQLPPIAVETGEARISPNAVQSEMEPE